jgi:hypothetical protein
MASVAAAATPVRLGRDLILAKAPVRKDLSQRRDHRRLAEHIRVPVSAAELDLRGFGAEQRRVACRPAEPVQPAQPGPGRGEELLLVLGFGDFDGHCRDCVTRKRLGHRQDGGQRRLVTKEQMPVRLERDADLAAWTDSFDLVACARRTHPLLARTFAVPDHVERQRQRRPVKRADRIAPADRPRSNGADEEHHVLAGFIPEPVKFRRGQQDPLHGRRYSLGSDDLEGQSPGGRQRAGQLRERVVETHADRSRQGVVHAWRPSFRWRPAGSRGRFTNSRRAQA